ncbi:peptidase M61 [Aestuariibaculum sp. YM273]|uniref:M61 family metallopeptidase n=1 Tax=Aestuariibaculum sp. YM273 TaxID=3070659 RepID=UPI0027DD2ADE|nr:peptidase M61 [Aestuariibaculum sp. YM273]WMI65536.1 peptidase M61 [Aestuariibaculum sp. YM273]
MNTKPLTALLAAILMASCGTSKTSSSDLAVNAPIETSINLSHVVNDKAPVTINPGRFTTQTVIYRLPRVIQGTYSVSDFGKYVDDFKAFDYDGNEMPVVKTDENTWTIDNAKKLDKITYLVNDTFDIEEVGGIGEEQPFSPAGTNIEQTNDVLNLHGFIGYFDSLKSNQYKLDVTVPSNFTRSSALEQVATRTSEDGRFVTTSYFASRYFDITDNPMFYGNLSVEEFQVGDIKIVLSVYSPNKVHSAQSLKETIFKMMKAQKTFLGDINSTPRYDIFLYLSEGLPESPKGYGALEHHTSTVVVLPEASSDEELAESMIDVVSHEFFHIVTPLSVHSEDVHYFDYNNPTFSKHLWMYEGVTEYFATLFQVNQDLVSEADFYNKIIQKIQMSKTMDDAMSFTIMSENVLKDPYKDQYINVYQKGALIGMCIDIMLREESNGERGILWLMKELSNKYGKDKPFEDDKLIDEIVAMTYPSLREFFNSHVIGDTPIDYNVFLNKVGLELGEGEIPTNYVFNGGALIFAADPQAGKIFFSEAVKDNSFWNDNGVQPGDVLKTVNGTELTMQNANQLLQLMFSWNPGQEIEVILDRNREDVVLKTTTTQSYTMGEGIMEKEDATAQQIKLREAWLKG